MTTRHDPAALAARAAEAIAESLGLAYAWLAPDLSIQQTSANIAAVLGQPGLRPDGRPLTECVAEFVGAEDLLRWVLDGRSPEFRLERINRRGLAGSVHYLDFWVVPGDDARPAASLLLIVADATPTGALEQRLNQDRNELRLAQTALADANERLGRLSRFKSFVLSMVAHDLRSPLAGIGGYAQLLRQPDLAAAGRADATTSINLLVDRLNLLIDNLVDLDQIEQGRLRIDASVVDVAALVDEVATALGERAAAQELTLRRDVPPEPLLAEADPNRVRQMLHNLLSNAIKYTPAGGQVIVSARPAADGPLIEVSDTGRGMTSAELDNLFQLYYRTDEARHSKAPGTGLGLYIVKTLAEAQGGRVAVASRPGQGTTLTLKLPAPSGG